MITGVIGDYSSYKPFEISISSLAFSHTSLLDLEDAVIEKLTLQNYPNPFTTSTTIKLIKASVFVNIKVVDMVGRIVGTQRLEPINKQVVYNAMNLSKGIYKYVIKNDFNENYSGAFVIE